MKNLNLQIKKQTLVNLLNEFKPHPKQKQYKSRLKPKKKPNQNFHRLAQPNKIHNINKILQTRKNKQLQSLMNNKNQKDPNTIQTVAITKITETTITVIENTELEIMTIKTEIKTIININSTKQRITDIEIKTMNKRHVNIRILEKEVTHL